MEIKYYIRNYINELNAATKAYDEGNPYMSDAEWDKMYYDLEAMEKDSGIIYPDSPTQSIQYKVMNNLEKVIHNHPMLSLGKTKNISEAEKFKQDYSCIIMSKMDGLTCSLTYEAGKLVRAETRGNGQVGEDITHNALVISSIPKTIPDTSTVIIDGEIICTYSDFTKFSNEYKNPRNFASGSIRLLDSKECAKRDLTFVTWDCITKLDYNTNTLHTKLNLLDNWGFITVPWCCPSADDSFESCVEFLKNQSSDYPIDGLVLKIDDCAQYSREGLTAHHPKGALAFKFYDEEYETELLDIEWGTGRGDNLTPVAIFKPVDDGESVFSRASLHNWSVLHETLGHPYIGQKISVAKMNMIIPQIVGAEINKIVDNYDKFNYISMPNVCPVCGGDTKLVESDGGVFNLICTNPQCSGKNINILDHFCGKKGLDIKGLSKATLEKLIDWGWLNKISDIYNLYKYRNEWILKPGFGPKSVDNILKAIENSKNCELHSFISALGIPLIGSTYAKEIAKHDFDYFCFRECIAGKFSFTDWNGFGYEMCKALWNFDYTEADKLADDILNIKNSLYIDKDSIANKIETKLNGKSVVITGRLELYKNRAELQNAIETAGGKVVNSISKNTFVLINNDTESTSSKNLSAKKLGIPIISEKEFQEKFLNF